MPEEKDRFQYHDEPQAKFTISDLERLFRFFREVHGQQRGDMTRKEEQEVGKAIDDLNKTANPVPKPT